MSEPLNSASSQFDSNPYAEMLRDVASYEAPPVFYRFFSGSSSITSLTEGKIKLTPPADFNDPFEIFAGVSDENLSAENALQSFLRPRSLFRQAIEDNSPNYPLKEMGFEEATMMAIKTDPKYWRQMLRSSIQGLASAAANQTGVSCFSAFDYDELHGELGIHHWSMYGGKHRGFALEYDGTHQFFKALAASKWFFPVEYCEERFTVDLTYFDDWDDSKMMRTFRIWAAKKSRRAWEHEREWRLMCFLGGLAPQGVLTSEPKSDGSSNYFMNLWGGAPTEQHKLDRAHCMTKVILGARAPDTLIQQVIRAVQQPHLKHVEVWKVEPSDCRYALVPSRIA